ncbi:hypothetical protein GJV85_08695 [Sulfurimonas aquatica]|uniref:CEP76/DRC7 peptidase-like domain-containing protein n=1 Tax=Sulfurimonas aquatica TaxID=2672570 RepID=A0A975GCY6_9BACT|nr:transglutaminase-like domain-containing protein [Sulfurimonas aquatica]QSZ42186.1 hypothetical protein GJV85_08695 [Sulfurimonas aquatica]
MLYNVVVELYNQYPVLAKLIPVMFIASLLLLISIYKYAGKAMSTWILFLNLIIFSIMYIFIVYRYDGNSAEDANENKKESNKSLLEKTKYEEINKENLKPMFKGKSSKDKESVDRNYNEKAKSGKTKVLKSRSLLNIGKLLSVKQEQQNTYIEQILPFREEYFNIAAPSSTARLYYSNAYLVGYNPKNIKSVWEPLSLLRTRIKYQLDTDAYNGKREVWQTSREASRNLRGDCEDHAILLADWLIGQGYNARVVIGTITPVGKKEDGHAWVVLYEKNKEYILEATQKNKWSHLPLAKSLPQYHPEYMFNRKYFWQNTGSKYTVNYHGEKWVLRSEFLPDDPIYLDKKSHALKINVKQDNAKIKIMNIKPKYHDGILLYPGMYQIELSKKGYLSEKFWISMQDKDILIDKVLVEEKYKDIREAAKKIKLKQIDGKYILTDATKKCKSIGMKLPDFSTAEILVKAQRIPSSKKRYWTNYEAYYRPGLFWTYQNDYGELNQYQKHPSKKYNIFCVKYFKD